MSNAEMRASKAYIITGPTSGIGLAAAYELAKHENQLQPVHC